MYKATFDKGQHGNTIACLSPIHHFVNITAVQRQVHLERPLSGISIHCAAPFIAFCTDDVGESRAPLIDLKVSPLPTSHMTKNIGVTLPPSTPLLIDSQRDLLQPSGRRGCNLSRVSQ